MVKSFILQNLHLIDGHAHLESLQDTGSAVAREARRGKGQQNQPSGGDGDQAFSRHRRSDSKPAGGGLTLRRRDRYGGR